MSRLYLVDDHTIVRDGLRAMLESGAHEVVGEAAEPVKALEDIARLAPEVLLLDLRLEGCSGLDLLVALDAQGLKVPTLVLTMSQEPGDVADALGKGALGYLLKDASRAELLEAVACVAQGLTHLSSRLSGLFGEKPGDLGRPDLWAILSPRERQIIVRVVKGQSSRQIGEQLQLSPKTVDTYRSRLMTKLGVDRSASLVRLAILSGLVDEDGN